MSDLTKPRLPLVHPTEHSRALGRVVRFYRKAAGLTIGEMAREVGLSVFDLSALEHGRLAKRDTDGPCRKPHGANGRVGCECGWEII
jgi:hypothetical protein